MNDALLKKIIQAIAVITIVSGGAQVVAPEFVLNIVGGEINDTSKHFFAIVGMFMVLFGGLTLHAFAVPQAQSVAFVWAGLQKLGAAVAVSLGVINAIFSPLALLVAGFDFLSAVLFYLYWKRIKS